MNTEPCHETVERIGAASRIVCLLRKGHAGEHSGHEDPCRVYFWQPCNCRVRDSYANASHTR